jgi:uncharacterized protein (DUF58 family)
MRFPRLGRHTRASGDRVSGAQAASRDARGTPLAGAPGPAAAAGAGLLARRERRLARLAPVSATPDGDRLPGEILRQVRRLEIRARAIVTELFAGEYHSVFKGRGMEFAEVREYVPGDDIRTIDWNVTARYGTPFVKKFVEEREMTVFLLVDVSGSQYFGSANRSKLELAAEVGALLAFSAINNHDKVGLLAFSDAVELFVPPRKGRVHGLRLVRDMLSCRPRGRGTDLCTACETTHHALKRRSVVFLLSDFLLAPESWEHALALLGRKHDLIALEIRDPVEEAQTGWPRLGLIEWDDPETGARVLFDTNDARARERLAARFARQREQTAALLRRRRVDHVVLEVGRDPVEPLLAFFRLRERRRARE